jgi:hypothetical protein
MQDLNPRSITYQRDLASITGKYPYAFTKSANGLEEGLIKSVTSMNSQNEIWGHSEATRQSHNEQLSNSLTEKWGVTPVVDADGNVDPDATRKKAETARSQVAPPTGMTAAEIVQTDPVTGIKTTFKTTEPKVPASALSDLGNLNADQAARKVYLDKEVDAGRKAILQKDIDSGDAAIAAWHQTYQPQAAPSPPAQSAPAAPANRPPLDNFFPAPAQ